MTKEEKQLLLVDLCARLPYGVIVDDKAFVDDKIELSPAHIYEYFVGAADLPKPYLRPMSSMAEDEKSWFNSLRNALTYQENGEYDLDDFNELQDFLNRSHIDYRGLIEMGLALEAPQDMYC